MGWAEIKKAINSNLNKPLDTLIQEKYTETTANITSCRDILYAHTSGVRDTVNAIYGTVVTGNKSVIKSIQRGRYRTNDRFKDVIIQINEINPNKSMVNITSSNLGYWQSVVIVSSTAISIQGDIVVDWEIIEFY